MNPARAAGAAGSRSAATSPAPPRLRSSSSPPRRATPRRRSRPRSPREASRGAGRRASAVHARRRQRRTGRHDRAAADRSRRQHASKHSVAVLRVDLIPRTLGRVPGVRGGGHRRHRRDIDFTHKMMHGLPYVIAFVLGLAFLILLVTFRSLVIPIKAIVLNLLSVGRLLRRAGARLPAALGRGDPRLPLGRLDHLLAARVPLRRPLRPLDGLPRIHPQPGARRRRRRHEHRRAVRHGVTGPRASSRPQRW